MTANYPASILPPNATAVERAIDRASAAALASLPVHLIRWVKDPDSCPLALLPWLAWEYQVDTWNIDWSEQKKRDAIKRAHYIHRHRGTVAAVRHALVDSPFGTDIVEWFNQNPKGDPYTFRLNVYQNDLPVTEYDQQDLKLAVLRARNLRSWFSVHVFGRLQGTTYAAGYMYATEKITPRFVPLQVILSRDELNLAPGDSETVTVTILPEYAEDKTFTVTTSDKTIATARIVNGAILVTGVKRGTCSVTVTTTNGVSAVISVKVVAVMKFITRIDNASRPLFYVRMDEDFTIDYGDGTDSREYIFDVASTLYGWVVPTRALTVGEEYTITVKGSESASFQRSSGTVSTTLNAVREIIHVTGNRNSLNNFMQGATSLIKIHPGAFDDLPAVTGCVSMFSGCSSLSQLPPGLFSRLHNVTNFSDVFAGCISLVTLPDRLFDGLLNVTTFSRAFSDCFALTATGDYLFRGCASARSFERVFNNCRSLITIGRGIFTGCDTAQYLKELFRSATSLASVPDDLFSNLPATDFSMAFYQCSALTELPRALFRSCTSALTFSQTFANSGLKTVPDGLFSGLSSVTNFSSVFYGCGGITSVGDDVFRGCTRATNFETIFYNCRAMTAVGENIFAGCVGATTFAGAFYACSSLLSMPSFADCDRVTTFYAAFRECSSLPDVPAGAFAGKSLVTTFSYAFFGCSSLIRVNAGAFRDCRAATTFSDAFEDCRSLVGVASDIFAGCVSVSGIDRLFSGCSAMAELPPALFRDFGSVSQMTSTFQNCAALETLPADLFDDCPALTSLSLTFGYCLGLRSLPPTLLAKTPRLTNVGGTFMGCRELKSLPADLFEHCPLLVSVYGTFQETGLMEIPPELFAHNPLITAFGYTFAYCSRLERIPAGLAEHNTKVTQFNATFLGCRSLVDVSPGLFNGADLTMVYHTFEGCVALSTPLHVIFDQEIYPRITITTSVFQNCLSLSGRGLEFIGKVPAATDHHYTFFECRSLDDYNQLPGDWREGML